MYDRDSPKQPAAQLSKYGVTFSTCATPLLSPHTRLARTETHYEDNPLVAGGPVSWIVAEYKHGYKIIDKSTHVVLGRWRRSTSVSEDDLDHEVRASRRYFSVVDKVRTLGRSSFFSGDASAEPSNWTLAFKGNLVATLKGYDLMILQAPRESIETSPNRGSVDGDASSPHSEPLFLDEFMRTLRQRHANYLPSSTSTFLNVTNDAKQSPPHEPPSFLHGVTSHNTATYTATALRLKLVDAVIMASMSLMLNLDDLILHPEQHKTSPGTHSSSEPQRRHSVEAMRERNKEHIGRRKSIFGLPSFLKSLHA